MLSIKESLPPCSHSSCPQLFIKTKKGIALVSPSKISLWQESKRKGKERKGKERKGKERKGKERKGEERRGEYRRGEERRG
jgi:hypothetical protein